MVAVVAAAAVAERQHRQRRSGQVGLRQLQGAGVDLAFTSLWRHGSCGANQPLLPRLVLLPMNRLRRLQIVFLRNGRYHFPRSDLRDLLQGLRPQPRLLLLWLLQLLVWLQPQRLVDPGRKNCRKCAPTWCNITGHSKGACCCSLKETNLPSNASPGHASIPPRPFTCSSENRIVLFPAKVMLAR